MSLLHKMFETRKELFNCEGRAVVTFKKHDRGHCGKQV